MAWRGCLTMTEKIYDLDLADILKTDEATEIFLADALKLVMPATLPVRRILSRVPRA